MSADHQDGAWTDPDSAGPVVRRPLTELDVDRVLDECTFPTGQVLTAPLPLSAEDAFRCAAFGLEHQPTYVPIRVDQYCPRGMIVSDGPGWVDGVYFDPEKFRAWIDDWRSPAIDVASIPNDHDPYCPPNDPLSARPKHERRQEGAISVRSWFRKMRAADFQRGLQGISVPQRLQGIGYFWTLFDTQKVVDRETAAHYLKPDLTTIWFVQGGRVVGKIENVAIERGVQDLQTFVRSDDANRSELVGQEPRLGDHVCSRCGGRARLVGAPMGYVGPGSGSLLYHYARLLEPDRRYLVPNGHVVKMCDACQFAESFYVGDRSERR